MKKIAILSHTFGNIGHTFMEIGVKEVVYNAFGNDVEITSFEQHNPFSVYPRVNPLYFLDKKPLKFLNVFKRFIYTNIPYENLWKFSKDLDYDLAICSGGPNLVPQGNKSYELSLLLHHMNGAFFNQGIPICDLAVGSCFPLVKNDFTFEDDDKVFYKKAISYVKEITVREKVAQKVLNQINIKSDILPCVASASGRYFEKFIDYNSIKNKNLILINYQLFGANTDWDQGIDTGNWRKTISEVIQALQLDGFEVAFICHSSEEKDLADKFELNAKVFYPKTLIEYVEIIKNARAALVSRIHAAIALAGIGVPSVVTGTDTRLLTINEFNLPTFKSIEVDSSKLIVALKEIINKGDIEYQRLINLRENTIETYSSKLKNNVV